MKWHMTCSEKAALVGIKDLGDGDVQTNKMLLMTFGLRMLIGSQYCILEQEVVLNLMRTFFFLFFLGIKSITCSVETIIVHFFSGQFWLFYFIRSKIIKLNLC